MNSKDIKQRIMERERETNELHNLPVNQMVDNAGPYGFLDETEKFLRSVPGLCDREKKCNNL